MKIDLEPVGDVVGESSILDLERELGVSLPSAYRDFLLYYNGGHPKRNIAVVEENRVRFAVRALYGVSAGPHYNLMERQSERCAKHLLAIGEDDFNNRILISLRGPDRGTIFFLDLNRQDSKHPPGYEQVYQVSRDFESFISSLSEKQPLSEDEIRMQDGAEVWIDADFFEEQRRLGNVSVDPNMRITRKLTPPPHPREE